MGWLMSDNLLSAYNIEPIMGQHLPVIENNSVTKEIDWRDHRTSSFRANRFASTTNTVVSMAKSNTGTYEYSEALMLGRNKAAGDDRRQMPAPESVLGAPGRGRLSCGASDISGVSDLQPGEEFDLDARLKACGLGRGSALDQRLRRM